MCNEGTNLHILCKHVCHFYAKCVNIGKNVHFTGGTLSQEQIRVILWWQQGSRKKIQTSLSSARSHVQLYKIGSCQINDDKVSIVHFHVLMSFYSIYAILSQIRFCRDLCFFCVNFWGQKLRLRKFFDKYDVCFEGQQKSCLMAAEKLLYLLSLEKVLLWELSRSLDQTMTIRKITLK